MLVVPIFIVFLVGQRYFRQGVALTGFKLISCFTCLKLPRRMP